MGGLCDNLWFLPSNSTPEVISKVYKSICKIQLKDNIDSDIFYGFLIKLQRNNQNFFCMITGKDSITEEMINKNENLYIHYDNNKSKRKIILNKNERYIEYITENNLDLCIIEILPIDKIEESSFLLPNMNNNYEEFNNKEITIIGDGEYSYGKIEKVNEDNFVYKINNEFKEGKIKTRIPIFIKNNTEVIGISKQDKKAKAENFGDFLKFIFIKLNQKKEEIIKEIKEGKRIELEDGGYYIGELTDEEIPNGKGQYIFKNGEIYEGNVIDDKFEGYGKYIYENGEYYIGQWKEDLRNGKGILYYKNGSIKYEGDFLNDKFEGEGKYFWENGEYYIGEYKNGLNNGRGILYYKNGSIKYEGNFLNDKFEGKGKYYDQDEQYYYEGQFKNGLKDGKGTLFYKNGNILYDGDFKEGKYDGEGKYTYENGDYYIGQFKDDLYNGKGKEYDKDGNIINEGEWENDIKI